MGFSRHQYWSGLPFPSPGDLLDPVMETASPKSPALTGRFFYYRVTWEAQNNTRPPDLPPEKSVCRKQQLELDVEQQTDSKSGKEYVKAVYCHPAYLTYMQSTSWETLGWMKHKLESRLPREISITSDMQMTPPLWQKVKRTERLNWTEAVINFKCVGITEIKQKMTLKYMLFQWTW